jgi:zinc-binding alcohol dehydrogenase family protein
MKAVAYLNSLPASDDNSLIDIELPTPEPQAKDLLVKVQAISVNPVDTKIRMRVNPEGTPKVLGWDAVGEVVAVGDQANLFKTGDRVWYAGELNRQGSNAQFQLVDERIVGNAPQSLSDAQAAALPLTAITAWELLFDRLQVVRHGHSAAKQSSNPSVILIVGAAGGVGSILVQLASKLSNSIVIGTASRKETSAWIKSLGADYVINHHHDLVSQLESLKTPQVSHAICLNQTDQHMDSLIELLAPQGKLALIDDPVNDLDIKKLKQKSLSLHWEFMYTRSMFQTDDMQEQHNILNEVAQLIDDGTIQTTIGEHFGVINAENLRRAHQQIESNTSKGKIVLEGFG